jgi:S-disulfanyl-L-cysteine oxidoreductase SoxD
MESDAERARVFPRSHVISGRGGAKAVVVAFAVSTACRSGDRNPVAQASRHYDLGRPATSVEVAARDVDVGPDGAGLPAGSGTVAQGSAIYAAQCASCHGERGEGKPPLYPRLIGRDSIAEGFPFGKDPRLVKTIGNYWPYATTVFDYVRRAMPQMTPGSLTNDQVYAVTAYLLAANRIIPMTASLDSASLVAVKMPYADRFVRDDRRGGREVK